MLTVADRLDLAELSARYAMLVDRRDFGTLVELFTPDAELVLPDPPASLAPIRPVTGRAAIGDSMVHLSDIPVTLHAVLGTVIDQADDPTRAVGRVTAEAHHLTTRDDQHRNLVWYLHYDDEYRRIGGAWQISRRSVQIDWIETRPVRSRRTGDLEDQ
ncbi:nuclear transport factor 2 family protein [Nakamurella lactea]|jgi:hypothetical protein|uniref:nuclear transport factor 2 family protein n=1 Tax=Nakamurella lactea TaxID=459515 RepID=UPI00041E32AC|nr:nuclear transport factor 2 family protein [Nakamurella lactea]